MRKSEAMFGPAGRKVGRLFACAAMVLAVGGCSSLPRSVSSLSEVQESSEQGLITLIPLSAQTLPPPQQPLQSGFPPELTQAEPFDHSRLGPGDRLHVRIWEGGTPTVFTGPAGPDLGELTVDEAGRIYLPFVGAVEAAGNTVAEVRAAVIRRLGNVVLRPQVDIREVERRSALISVQGDAAKTGVFPIERGRTRLGALLAEVAPNQENAEMLEVTVRREGTSGRVRLSDIYANSALDIALRPGDSIILNRIVENVTVLGAAGIQGQVRIPERRFSLIDAIGQARGLSDDAADPRAVFLMRAQGVNAQRPLVYQLDMRRPDAIALASRFIVQDDDAILISSAPFAQTRKMLSAFAQSLGTVRATTSVVP